MQKGMAWDRFAFKLNVRNLRLGRPRFVIATCEGHATTIFVIRDLKPR